MVRASVILELTESNCSNHCSCRNQTLRLFNQYDKVVVYHLDMNHIILKYRFIPLQSRPNGEPSIRNRRFAGMFHCP